MEYLVHMGYSKTGSSYIQSALARTDLAKFGVLYPIDTKIREIASLGQITSGNFWPRAGALEALIGEFVAAKMERLLISSEAIFDVVSAPNSKFISSLQSFFPDAKIKAICFVRDPVDHAVSVYQQMVKRGGYTGSFADSLSEYDVITKCRTVFSRLRDANVEFSIFNYSHHENRIALDVETWLGLPSGALELPVADRVNRSMTRAELQFQIEFNKYFGSFSAQFVSDPLCNILPHVKSEIPAITLRELGSFVDRMRNDLDTTKLEDFMPKEELPRVLDAETYLARFAPSENDQILGFSARQIEVLVDAIVAGLPKLKIANDHRESKQQS